MAHRPAPDTVQAGTDAVRGELAPVVMLYDGARARLPGTMPTTVGKTAPRGGDNVIRRHPTRTREVVAVRLEPELREALDREAEKRCVSRSVLVRDALMLVVDQDVLEKAAQRERPESFRRGMKADGDRLRAMLSQNDHRARDRTARRPHVRPRAVLRRPGNHPRGAGPRSDTA